MNFLNRDEVLMHARGWLGLYPRGSNPQDKDDLLKGIRRLWTRIVKFLPPEELREWENYMNDRIRDANGSQKISLTDKSESYLNLLDPLAATSPGWGRGILAFHENLGTEPGEPEVYLTPESEEAKDPEALASELAENLIAPLNDPFE